MSLSPLASTLIYATRYSHGRSLAPHEDVQTAARQVWPILAARDRAMLLLLWREQVPPEFGRRGATHSGSVVPVTTAELSTELASWEQLWAWCDRRMGALSTWPCVACGCAPGGRADGCACRCHTTRRAQAHRIARSLFPRSAGWVDAGEGAAAIEGGTITSDSSGGYSSWSVVVDSDRRVFVSLDHGGARFDGIDYDGQIARRSLAWLRARVAGGRSPRQYMRRRAEDARAVLAALGEAS